jgi:ribosomal protein L7/L12
MSNDQSLQTQLRDAIARGDKDAVKALMRQGGITGLLQTLRAVQATAVQQSMQASTQSAVQVPAAVKIALQQGNLIEAVKRVREANPGISLKAAKDHVDALGARVPVKQIQRSASTFATTRERTPTVVMGDKPGSLRWLFVLIAFVMLVWWWWTT